MILDRAWHLLTAGLLLVACTNDYDGLVSGGAGAAPGDGGAGSTVGSGGHAPGVGGGGTGATSSGGASTGTGGGASSSGGQGGGPPGPVCGDGVKNGDEPCDGGMAGNAYCTAGCTEVICNCPAALCVNSIKAFFDKQTGHCFYLSQTDNHHWSWADSREWCQNEWDGDLAVFEVDDERELLTPQLPKEYLLERMWLGGEEGPANQFTWVSGGGVPSDQALWGADEPDGGGKDCLAIGVDGLYYDLGCAGQSTHHVCERKAAGEP